MPILLLLTFLLQSVGSLQVTVRDSQGLPISGARITVTETEGTGRQTAISGNETSRIDGLAASQYDIRVEASGFATKTVSADLRTETSASVDVQLEVATILTGVTVAVTRTEQEIGNLPASVTIVDAEEIKHSPAVAADDILRGVNTFSLFRRTSSLAAHPTAQGVSLRAVGPSGGSRTLVLIDNVPFNDPFGGWVYWTRIPMASVRQIELVNGANSSVYGNYALGGVINIVTAPPEGRTFKLKETFASRATLKHEFFAGSAWNKFGIAAEGSLFDTDGYFTVPALEGGSALRGLADTRATVHYDNANLKMDFNPTDRITAFVRGGYFSEDRINGKVDETNNTIWKSVSGGIQVRMPDESDLQARVWGNWEAFHANTLAITNFRNTTRLTLLQRVPTNDTGGMLQWSRAISAKNYFTVGADWRWVDGDSREGSFALVSNVNTQTVSRISGGTQRSIGVFIQDVISVTPQFQVTLSARLDRWKNYDAHNLNTDPATGANLATNRPSCNVDSSVLCLSDKKNTVGNPKLGAIYHVNDQVSIWGSASWGFRAPTLNELYRQFAVGTTTTLGNDQLGPERLTSGEGGLNLSPIRNLTWRSSVFVNKFTNPISNVTTNVSGANVTRQRLNLGKTRIWGVQSEIEYRVKSDLRLSWGYLYNVAKVRESRADFTGVSLVGKFLAEAPRHRGSAELVYSNPKFVTATASVQITGGQYDDDLNTLWLPYYGAVDFNASRKVARYMEFFFGVQNVLDREFYVQRNPTTTGAPRFVTGGLEFSWK